MFFKTYFRVFFVIFFFLLLWQPRPTQVKEWQSVDGSTGLAGPYFLVPSPAQHWSLCWLALIGPTSLPAWHILELTHELT